MKRGLVELIFFSFIILFTGSVCFAQDSYNHNLDSYFRFMPASGVDAMDGKVELIKAGSEYSYEFKAGGKMPLKLSIGTQYIGIENGTPVELPSSLTGLTSDFEASLPFFNFDKTYFRLGISPSFYSQGWDLSTSAFRIPSRYLIICQPNDLWTLIAGVAVLPDFDQEVMPILGFIYKPDNRLTFTVIPTNPGITYLLNEKLTLFAEGKAQYSEFEVTRDSSNGVIIKYREMGVGVGAKYKINDNINLCASVGGALGRSLKYRDGAGKVNIDNGFYGQAKLEVRV